MPKKIAVIGDLIIDKFIDYKSLRLSPEGPAPVVKKMKSYAAPGGAANVALSLINLGLDLKFYYPMSNNLELDEEITLKKVLNGLEVCSQKIMTDIENINPVKTRHYVDQRQYMREDKEGSNLNKISIISEEFIDEIVKNNDFILVSDYQKGCFNTETLQYTIKVCNEFKKPIFIDTKNNNFKAIRNSFCLKINKAEFNILFPDYELKDISSIEIIKEKVKKVKNHFNIKNLVVTLGSQGCISISRKDIFYYPAFKVDVIDITGAGDAFLSALLFSFIKNKSDIQKEYFENSLSLENIKFANYAASSVVAKKGTVSIDSNCLKLYEAKPKSKKVIGFTNGCFDILHVGHLYLLEQAKKNCDYLIVGLNSDYSIKKIKGNKRPINKEDFRIKLLLSLKMVDKVIIFDEDNPLKLIEEIRPDILIKGNDYKEEEIIGASFVKSYGGKILRIKFEHNISTSNIIDQIKFL